MKSFSSLSHLFLMILFSSCSTFQTTKLPYVLKIQAQEGQKEYSIIHIAREISYYENQELSHQSIRKIKFRVQSEIDSVEPSGIWVKNTTFEKEGEENLRGYGFPELRETIRLKLNFQGKVLHVDGYKKDSVFYLPPILLPKDPVKKNDEWSQSFSWKNEEKQRFKTIFTSRFLKTDTWKGKEVIKIQLISSTVWEDAPKEFTFSSSSDGYYLWDIQKGNVVYSESEGQDILESTVKDTKVVTDTTFTSEGNY